MLIGCCGRPENCDRIAAAGYDYLELSGRSLMELGDEEYAAFRMHLLETGVPCRGINDFCGGDHPIVGPGADPDSLCAYTERMVERAAGLGAKSIGIGAPAARKLPPGYDPKHADLQMKEFLKTACRIAAGHGISILLEAVHSGMCDYLNYTADARRMVEELRLPNLFLVYDRYHAEFMGEDLFEMLRAMPWIRHLHYSSDLGVNDRGYVTDACADAFCQFVRTALRAGYRGAVSIEANTAYLETDGEYCLKLMREGANK